MQCVVQKDFLGGGVSYVRNQLVEGDQFRNVGVLISQRYLRPATPDEIASAVPVDDEEEAPAPWTSKKKGMTARVAHRRS